MEIVDLGVLGEKVLAEAHSAASGRYGVTVHGGRVHALRQTLVGLAAGRSLDEHENTAELTLHLIRGRARVVAGSDVAELAAGDYVVIPMRWNSFEALEDTIVLLTAAVMGSPD